jgi:hypothetical protein
MRKKSRKTFRRKIVLRLPDLDHAKHSVQVKTSGNTSRDFSHFRRSSPYPSGENTASTPGGRSNVPFADIPPITHQEVCMEG